MLSRSLPTKLSSARVVVIYLAYFTFQERIVSKQCAGHMEENILLATMKISKPLFMDIACDVLGLKTVNAKNLSHPEPVSTYIYQNKSFSHSGDQYRGEGDYYGTETENKHLRQSSPQMSLTSLCDKWLTESAP